MLAFEALNTAPKTPKANLKQEDIKENTTLSFDSLLKSITKKDKTDAETTLILIPREKDTKTQLLDLLKSPSKIQEQQEKVIETTPSKNNNTPNAEVKETNLDKLLQLLKSDDPKEIKELKTPLEINPDVSEKLSPSELKDLIYKAKKYLKEKIE
ncbi:MAG: hypothetical protein GXO11_04790, partial [Epsilonproteobacteria bacterium]|nr:hypothetical protein [Campylobacterota bacterium]